MSQPEINVINKFEGKFGFHEYTKFVFDIFPEIVNQETTLLNVSDAHMLRNDFKVCMTYMAFVLNTTYQFTYAENKWTFNKYCELKEIQKAYVDFIINMLMCNNCYNFDTHLVKNDNDIWIACNICQDFNKIENINDILRTRLIPLLENYNQISQTFEILEREPPKPMTEDEIKLRKEVETIFNNVKPSIPWLPILGQKTYPPTIFNYATNKSNILKQRDSENELYRRFEKKIAFKLHNPVHTVSELISFAKENEMFDEAIVPIIMNMCNEKIFEDNQLHMYEHYIIPFVKDNQTAQVQLILAIEALLNKYYFHIHEHYSNLLHSLLKLKYVNTEAFKIAVDTPNIYIQYNMRNIVRVKTDEFYMDLCKIENISGDDADSDDSDDSFEIINYNKSHDVLPPYKPVTYTSFHNGVTLLQKN